MFPLIFDWQVLYLGAYFFQIILILQKYNFMRRKSGATFEQIVNKDWALLSKNQHNQLQSSFKKTEQRNGGISFYDLINIIRNQGITISDERKDIINKELKSKEIRILDFTVLLNVCASLKKQKQQNFRGEIPEENEYLDAFVALGGGNDKSGYVNKSALMEIVKRQFELSLDLETMIDGLQSDNLDYDLFCSIFQQDKQKNEGRLASAASQRSLRSQGSMKSLVLDERDFQKFLSQYENEDYN